MSNMEFRDLKVQYQRHRAGIDAAIQKVLMQTDFINGSAVRQLEQQLADYTGVRHCIIRKLLLQLSYRDRKSVV